MVLQYLLSAKTPSCCHVFLRGLLLIWARSETLAVCQMRSNYRELKPMLVPFGAHQQNRVSEGCFWAVPEWKRLRTAF